MLRVTLKDGRTFEGELFDRQYDGYKREGWFTLDVNYSRNPDPEVPEIFLFEECVRVVDVSQPDVDLLPTWQGMVTYATSPVRMTCIEQIGSPHTRPPLDPPSSFPTLHTCPACHTWHSVTFTTEEERFPYGEAPHAVALTAIVDRGRCAACAFEFTDARAEIARDAAVRAYLRMKESR